MPRAAAGPYSEVASSFDEPAADGTHDPFDLHVLLDYEYQMRSASIMRELAGLDVQPGDPMPVGKDLVFHQFRHVLVPRLELGIFHDFALTAALPIVILDARELELDQRDTPCTFGGPTPEGATCIDRDSSSTILDGLLPATGFDADDPATGFGSGARIFRGPDRSGLDQLHLGFTWAPMNQARDVTKPTWKLTAQLRLAVGKVQRFDPRDPTSTTGVGQGAHEVYLATSMAKRVGWAEPYFEAWWTAPVGYKDISPFADPGFGARSTDKQQTAGARFGFEAIAVDRGPELQKVSLDLSARIGAHFEGRAYSELWEVFALAGDSRLGGPLVLDRDPVEPGVQAISHPGISNVENYLELGGRAALRADLGPLVHIAAFGEFSRQTSHAISFADAGVDRRRCNPGEAPGADCEAEANEVVNPGTVEVNPVHVPLIDLVGHRYIVEGGLSIVVGVEARILF